MELSNESQTFLMNLKLYLVSSGKKESEVEDIVTELEDHLYEAEKNGKNVASITGQTPKEYMAQLADEMSFDRNVILKYVPIVMIGGFAYFLMGEAVNGKLAFSLLELVGYPVLSLFILFMIAMGFRYIASRKPSKIKEKLIYTLLGIVPIGLYSALIIGNRYVLTPEFHFGWFGNLVAVFFSIIVLIGMAIWSKAWFPVVLPFVLYLPQIIINDLGFQESTKAILTSLSIPLFVGGYLLIHLKILSEKR